MPVMRGGYGRREQQRLALVGQLLQDRLDVVGEAHVEHLVGFVEHDGVHSVETQRPPADVVEDAPGRADDHVHAAVERLQLAPDRLAAVDRHDLNAQHPAVLEYRLGDLHRQLPRRHQHQCRQRRAPARDVEPVEDRQRERRRLAGARGGLTDEIVPGDELGDGLALDRGRLLVAELGEYTQQLGSEAQVGKGCVLVLRDRVVGHGRIMSPFGAVPAVLRSRRGPAARPWRSGTPPDARHRPPRAPARRPGRPPRAPRDSGGGTGNRSAGWPATGRRR